ncbi:L-type lectin-domain containing receptor kinase IX.1-like [Gossypium arboreum]|uniref:Protein kinase domain-containing protein n=1 Tax=Gossypium arboreum TaxID=29729 RepID=A0ABR0MB93_GOSAR|nr:L-type lectin-domain containing receptor kinase IX.1-like [Gossypium arboreum]KAK5770489.1 hypothetical protein PVK06_046639 [Gossypium arboreum]
MKLCKNSVTICLFVLALLGRMETHGSLGANQPGSNQSNVTVAAAPSPSSTADGSSPQDYLHVHNAARAAVGVGPLTWDDVVARYAADHAKQRISQCELVESRGPYGENLAWSKNDLSGSDAVKLWIDEKHYYDFESNSCSPGYDCAYYTQVIWKYSIRLGCAKVRCNNGGTFIVCNYDPPAKHPENWSLIGAISPSPAAESDSFDRNDLMGLVVGLIVGACALIVVLCLGCCFCLRRKRNKDNSNGDHDNHVIIGAISPSAAPAPHSFPSEHPKSRKNIRRLAVGLVVGASGLILGLGLLVVGLIVGVSGLIFGLGVSLWFFLRRLRREDDTNVDNHNNESDMFFHDSDFQHGVAPRKFSLEELAKVTNMFKGEKLGEGGFGAVYRGYLRDWDTHVAVKRISKASKQGIKEYASEVKIISRLRHKNLVKLIGWCHEKRELLLVYEFMANGSLDSHLFKGKSLLNWEVRCKIVQDLASALLYLHEEGDHCVLHRDIKASNIMLDSNFNAKLGDFGLARLVDHAKGSQTTRLAGTIGYMAPECISSGKVSKESDVYSFGIVALEIACGRRSTEPEYEESKAWLVAWVWDSYGNQRLLDVADQKLCMEFDDKQIECLLIVGLWCVHPDPSSRPSIRQAIQVLNFEAPLPELPSSRPIPTYHAPNTSEVRASEPCFSCLTITIPR